MPEPRPEGQPSAQEERIERARRMRSLEYASGEFKHEISYRLVRIGEAISSAQKDGLVPELGEELQLKLGQAKVLLDEVISGINSQIKRDSDRQIADGNEEERQEAEYAALESACEVAAKSLNRSVFRNDDHRKEVEQLVNHIVMQPSTRAAETLKNANVDVLNDEARACIDLFIERREHPLCPVPFKLLD